MKWLMKRIATPCCFSRSTISNRRSTSLLEIAEVGSSMIRTRASSDNARTISMVWRSAMPSIFTGVRTSIAMLRRASSSRASARIATQSIRPRCIGWRPMNTFSATDRSGKTVGCW